MIVSKSRLINSIPGSNPDKLSSYLNGLKLQYKKELKSSNRDLRSEIRGYILSKIFSKSPEFFDITASYFKLKSAELVRKFNNIKKFIAKLSNKGLSSEDYLDIDDIVGICFSYVTGTLNAKLYDLVGLKLLIYDNEVAGDVSEIDKDQASEEGLLDVGGVYVYPETSNRPTYTSHKILNLDKLSPKDNYIDSETGEVVNPSDYVILIKVEVDKDDDYENNVEQLTIPQSEFDNLVRGNAVQASVADEFFMAVKVVLK